MFCLNCRANLEIDIDGNAHCACPSEQMSSETELFILCWKDIVSGREGYSKQSWSKEKAEQILAEEQVKWANECTHWLEPKVSPESATKKGENSARIHRLAPLEPLEWNKNKNQRIPYVFPEIAPLYRKPNGDLVVHEKAYIDDLLHIVGQICLSLPRLNDDHKRAIRGGITRALIALDHRAWLIHQYSEEPSARILEWKFDDRESEYEDEAYIILAREVEAFQAKYQKELRDQVLAGEISLEGIAKEMLDKIASEQPTDEKRLIFIPGDGKGLQIPLNGMAVESHFRNLTPHMVTVKPASGRVYEFKSEGVARINEETKELLYLNDFPIVAKEYSDITNLPPPKKGVFLIVSKMVVDEETKEYGHRKDLVSPDSGRMIRKPNGDPESVPALVYPYDATAFDRHLHK